MKHAPRRGDRCLPRDRTGMPSGIVEDFVIATGVQRSVRDFVSAAASVLDMRISWQGQGVDERAVTPDGTVVVRVHPRYFRPAEVETLLGDAGKAHERLGWKPKTSFEDLVREMALADFREVELSVRSNGRE